jgi:DNA-binding winged helix-turn-helix (wHTH) protein/tetratricopeptide (TPR) repeat protein
MSTDETPSQGEGTEPSATWRVHCPVGVVELDPGAREVWRDGELVVLAPPVFDCIAYLFAHRERAVGRDELIAAIWGRADITDTVLHQTVMTARRVFGDSGDEQQVLRTVPRFGDRWIATVEGATERAAAENPQPADRRDSRSSAPRPRSTRRRRGVIAIASGVFGVALLAGVGAWWWRAPEPESTRKPAIEPVDTRPAPTDAIVVLPVEVAAGRDTAWIPLGVMDAIGSYLRDGGEAIVPSQTVIGLIEAQGDSVPEAAQWRDTVGATRVVRAFATQRTDRWQVRLEFEEGGARQETSGEAPEVLAAAREASERLLAQLHGGATLETLDADPDALATRLLQRSRADMLANRLGAAGALLDSAPAELRDEPRIRLQRAEIDYRAGRMDIARTTYVKLLDELPAESQPLLRAQTLIALASIERTAGRMDVAESGYAQAIALLDPLDQPIWLGRAHLYRGLALGSLRRFDEAQREIAHARILLGGAGDVEGVASADTALATLNADRGRLTVASGLLVRAIAQLERLGVNAEVFNMRIALAQMSTELLDHVRALEQAERAWRSYDNRSGQRLYVMAGAMYARALGDSGRLAEAWRVLEPLETGPVEHDYQWRYAHGVAVTLALRAGDAERAARIATEVVDAQGADVHADIGPLLLGWTRSLRMQGKSADLDAALAQVAGWAARIDDDDAVPHIYAGLVDAEHAWAERRRADSYREYAKALARAGDLGVPLHIAVVANSWGNALISDGALDEAATVVGQVAAWADSDYDCAVLTARLHRAFGNRSAWERALEHARELAGERRIPDSVATFTSMPISAAGDL